MTSPTEEIIELAASMKDALELITNQYARLPKIIESENSCLKESSVNSLLAIKDEKVALTSQIEQTYATLRRTSEKLLRVARRIAPDEDFRTASLKESLAVFKKVQAHLSESGFGGQVYEHVLGGLVAAYETFASTTMTIKPQIEANRYVIKKALYNFQESLRFWQEVAAEVSQPYNQKGLQKNSNSNTVLNVKA